MVIYAQLEKGRDKQSFEAKLGISVYYLLIPSLAVSSPFFFLHTRFETVRVSLKKAIFGQI
jgi:hypothetical protein